MESLLVDCLPYLSDYLEVKDLFRLESVSKSLQSTIQQGDSLFHRSIRAQVGCAQDYPSAAPVHLGSGWKRQYSPETYPLNLCFHARLKYDGLAVENLSVDKIRNMGKAVARFQEELKRGAPPHDDDDATSWDRWYSPGYIGERGGSVRLDLQLVCGIVLVFSKHSFLRGDGRYASHGFLDDSHQCFRYALKRESVPMKPGDYGNCNSYPAPIPHRMYDDVTEAYIDPRLRFDFEKLEGTRGKKDWRFCEVWTRVDPTTTDIAGGKLGMLKDLSGVIFAITSCRQLYRRMVRISQSLDAYTCQDLTLDQREIAQRFLVPLIRLGPGAMYNARNVLGFDYTALIGGLD